MLFLSVFLLILAATDASMFPKACITPGYNDFPVPCCPLYNGTPCGSGENRGNCISLSVSRSLPPPDVNLDDRYMLPGYYFSTICQCKDNFFGINCGDCAPNRHGDNCEYIREDLVREEIRQKSEIEQKRYMVWLNFCKKKIDPDYYILKAGDRTRSMSFDFIEASYFEVWSYAHYFALKPFINNTRENTFINFARGSTAFLTWHRKSLLYLENRMQKCTKDPTFTLAYYDWQDDEYCHLCNNGFVAANDEQGYLHPHSAFSKWTMICADFDYPATYCLMSDTICERPKIRRQPGAAVGIVKPTRADVQYCLSLSDVESARNCIEGSIHAPMLQYFGGTMSEISIAANDPLCVFHQAFIDKIFDRYLVMYDLTKDSYPDHEMYGHGPYDCIMSFCQCTRNREMFAPSSTFGVYYSYYGNF